MFCEKNEEKIGVAGLRSPCLPHAKGVLYQVSYNPNYTFFLFIITFKAKKEKEEKKKKKKKKDFS